LYPSLSETLQMPLELSDEELFLTVYNPSILTQSKVQIRVRTEA